MERFIALSFVILPGVTTQACLQCGGGGGCVDIATVCAEPCETTDDCSTGTLCSYSTCPRGCF